MNELTNLLLKIYSIKPDEKPPRAFVSMVHCCLITASGKYWNPFTNTQDFCELPRTTTTIDFLEDGDILLAYGHHALICKREAARPNSIKAALILLYAFSIDAILPTDTKVIKNCWSSCGS